MRKRNISRAAVIAALLCIAILLGIAAFSNKHDAEKQSIDIVPVTTPESTAAASPAPTLTPQDAVSWIPLETTIFPLLQSEENSNDTLFTLTIDGKQIDVAYGVDENTLSESPGWLPSSALPGQDGMCVVYGHRNRTHLRVLEKVELGDTITVTMKDKTVYAYTVSDIKIYENTADFKLPTSIGKTLVLATCYPFRYSGNAPGKILIIAQIVPRN